MNDPELNLLADFYSRGIKLDKLCFERNIWFSLCRDERGGYDSEFEGKTSSRECI